MQKNGITVCDFCGTPTDNKPVECSYCGEKAEQSCVDCNMGLPLTPDTHAAVLIMANGLKDFMEGS